jgi:ATP-binding cassette, subfamily A (ABC1), member 3
VHSTESTPAPSMPDPARVVPAPSSLLLAEGHPRSPFSQASTIFHKRMLIARRDRLIPALTVVITVCGACVPLVFLSGQTPSCTVQYRNEMVIPFYWADSIDPWHHSHCQCAGIATQYYGDAWATSRSHVDRKRLRQCYVCLHDPTGLSQYPDWWYIDRVDTRDVLVAWDVTPAPGLAGPRLLNLATNILYNRALNASGNTAGTPSIITANYTSFAQVAAGAFVDLRLGRILWGHHGMILASFDFLRC